MADEKETTNAKVLEFEVTETDLIKTADGRVFKLVAADPNDVPAPQFWALRYHDQNGREWARFHNSQKEAVDFAVNNGYIVLALVQI